MKEKAMPPPAALTAFTERFLAEYFDARPTDAAYLGFHEYDGRVPDLSQEGIENRVTRLRDALDELYTIDADPLEPVDWLDYQLMRDAIQFELFDLTEWRCWQRDPQTYLWPMGVDQYIKRNYAPLPERVRGLTNHLRGLPRLVEQAKANLIGVPAPVLETAVQMLRGGIAFLESDLALALTELKESDPSLHVAFESAQNVALEAGRDLLAHLTEVLAPQAPTEFAIGADAFRSMLRYGEAVHVSLERLLKIGQADLARNKAAFVETAARIEPAKSPGEVAKLLIQDHPTVETLVQDTRDMLEELRQWVVDHDIVSLPYDERCTVEETPKFMRFAFAMMDSAGPFEPVARDAFYYVTPPEPDWPPEKQEEWLTAFDYHSLRATSIHEAWPGHFLNDLHFRNSPSRVTKIFSAYSFWEAWAHYCEQMMLEQGYRAGDDRLRLAQLSGALVRNVRYVCAIQMHTQGMTVEAATKCFMEDAFMEETPARAEAVRGTFDPQYLNYTLGKLMLLKLRDDYRAALGDAYDLKTFHDTFLAWGGPPVPYLRRLILQQDDGEVL
jgi:uncharacterized protein (DUF885 family)